MRVSFLSFLLVVILSIMTHPSHSKDLNAIRPRSLLPRLTIDEGCFNEDRDKVSRLLQTIVLIARHASYIAVPTTNLELIYAQVFNEAFEGVPFGGASRAFIGTQFMRLTFEASEGILQNGVTIMCRRCRGIRQGLDIFAYTYEEGAIRLVSLPFRPCSANRSQSSHPFPNTWQCDRFFELADFTMIPIGPGGEPIETNPFVILADRLLRQFEIGRARGGGLFPTVGLFFDDDHGGGSIGRLHNITRYRAFLNGEIITDDSCFRRC